MYGNRQAPSKDISHNFANLEYLRFLCSGGLYSNLPDNRLTRYV